MKRIEFTSPADGDVITDPGISMLRILFLYVSEEFWNSGSGDSCIDFYGNGIESRLEVLFSDPHGFYLRYKAKGVDCHSSNDKDFSTTTTVYVGGNSLVFPVKLFLSRELALKVVQHFYETGRRLDHVAWIDDDNLDWENGVTLK